MAIDYLNEMNNVLGDNIPQWFYELSVEQRNTILNSALTRYELITIAKNNTFLSYWTNLIAPYTPKIN